MLRRWHRAAGALLLTVSLAGCSLNGGAEGSSTEPGRPPVVPPTTTVDEPAATTTPAAAPPAAADRDRIASALRRAVRPTPATPGELRVAVWDSGWSKPLVVGRGTNKRVRMWSQSKVVTAITAAELGIPGDAETSESMEAALRRSENCRQRHVVLWIQEQLPGDQAERAFASVLERAGASGARSSRQRAGAESLCHAFLNGTATLSEPLADASLFGTATWTLRDAIALAHALASGTFGDAGEQVLALMSEPKLISRELPSADDFTASPEWGAGLAFGDVSRLAFKAGWGGAQTGTFTAGQFGIAWSGSRWTAFAVQYEPGTPVPSDDPGKTPAPAAIQRALTALANTLP